MPEWVAMILVVGMVVGMGFLMWKMHVAKEQREREKEQLKREKERMQHELNMKKIESGQKTTVDNVVEAVPESLKHIGNIISPWKWKKK